MLLTPPVRGHAPRLVHRQHRGHEQHHQADPGVEEFAPQPVEIGIPPLPLCLPCSSRPHVHQQDDGGKDGEQEFDQDPIVPEQAPRGAQRHDQPA